ncbi:ATP-binding protein [uncultured Thiodictyon sp.]|jgi:anti-sigma regulatory factor (Ser/Thr protein kinase)|uniref:ATP-binding protein n=1 Tax=uncultured Thiodictyon sp. TaxID=1846217 RepID=UPI0025D39D7A|nr:ATP-binding protein [uncultured Thiodictyon sp.]
MTTSATLLTLESDPTRLGDLQSRVDALCRDAGLEAVAANEFTTAIIEAVANSIRHGYRGEPGHPITVHWRCAQDRIDIEIRDRAPPPPAGFLDHRDMPPPAAESGRGVAMILAYTDAASYARIGAENVLNLTRRL